MHIHCDLDPALPESWRPTIARQFALTLDPLRARLRTARVRFAAEAEGRVSTSAQRGYRCEFTARGLHGESWRAVAWHRIGEVAILDAFCRARRSITRSRRTRSVGG